MLHYSTAQLNYCTRLETEWNYPIGPLSYLTIFKLRITVRAKAIVKCETSTPFSV